MTPTAATSDFHAGKMSGDSDSTGNSASKLVANVSASAAEKPQPVARVRARGDVSELDQHLRCEAQFVAAPVQFENRTLGRRVTGVRRVRQTNQNVRVEQVNGHS